MAVAEYRPGGGVTKIVELALDVTGTCGRPTRKLPAAIPRRRANSPWPPGKTLAGILTAVSRVTEIVSMTAAPGVHAIRFTLMHRDVQFPAHMPMILQLKLA